ncbi:hypothetical protein [Marinifilum sp. D714]|uniref:hypothetical protein n=1 Tax=Marinifilum sp. D714 TaxID=2937523 RepID=UPI0027C0FB94|nr:hypothetical protein [Marinifilum sp. D714]MDQ2179848.1 hypothetical protein [Marinifilum sp. D714]
MKKGIVMIYKLIIGLLLITHSINVFSQSGNTIQVSNQTESDHLEANVLSFLISDTLCIEVEKTLPLDKSKHEIDFRSEYIYPIPNTTKSILKLYFVDGKFQEGLFEKKSMQRSFNGAYQLRKNIETKDIQVKMFVVEKNSVEGVIKINLPLSFGWLASDSIVNLNVKSKIYDLPTKRKINPGSVQAISIQPDLFTNANNDHFELCNIKRDSVKSEYYLQIGTHDDLAGRLIYITLMNKHRKVKKISSIDYSDIEDEKTYNYPYYELIFNRDPFVESDSTLMGKYLIATDSLPQKYGDIEVQSGYFKCDN